MRRNNNNQKRVGSGRRTTKTYGTDPVDFARIARYRGPVKLPNHDEAVMTEKVNDSLQVAATTSGGGVIDLVFGNSPASLTDWTTLASVWHEYRVLAMELHYVPIKQVASWAYGPAHVVVDRKSSAALGGITAALQHESCEINSMYSPWKRVVKAQSVEEIQFTSTASPSANMYIKVYSSDNATIQTIGRFYLTYLIELRGKS